jgi:hypothetical protein
MCISTRCNAPPSLENQGRLDEAEAAYRAGADGDDEESVGKLTALLASRRRS